jgi:hypothetical protein
LLAACGGGGEREVIQSSYVDTNIYDLARYGCREEDNYELVKYG